MYCMLLPFHGTTALLGPCLDTRCLATRSRVPQPAEQYRRAAPRPTFTNGLPQRARARPETPWSVRDYSLAFGYYEDMRRILDAQWWPAG
jgi:hypothetical protein